MTDHHEDPAAQAGAKVMQWTALAATAAEALAQITAMRRQQAAERYSREAGAARAELRARYGRDALTWAPMLDEQKRAASDLDATRRAWATAQSWPGNPEADQAATLAEDRLRHLRPDVMSLYDQAREQGQDPLTAMRTVGDRFDSPEVRVGQPGPVRQQLAATGAERTGVDVRTDAPVVLLPEPAASVWERAPQPAREPEPPRLRVVDAEVVRSVPVTATETCYAAPLAAAGAVAVAASVQAAEPAAAAAQVPLQAAQAAGRR